MNISGRHGHGHGHGRHLPEEVIEDIIVRLPSKSIFRSQCVCKSWFNLIKNSPLIYNQLNQSDLSFIPLCFIHKSIQLKNSWLLNLFLFHADDDDYDDEEEAAASVTNCLTRFRKGIRRWLDALGDGRKPDAKYPLPVLNFKFPSSNQPSLEHRSGLELVGQCNGIMCLSHPNFILLVNPLLKELKTLSNPINPPRLVGFGFDNINTMDFKVVRLFAYGRQEEAQVYNLKTNVWRKTAFPFAFLSCIQRFTFLNGVIYWCVQGSVEGSPFIWRILTFNLATELFQLMDFPHNWSHGLLSYKEERPPVGLFVLNQDSLAFLNYTSSTVGVWTMIKHEETTPTWTQVYSIRDMPDQFEKPISFWNKDKLLYETKNGKLFLYDLLTHRLFLVFDHSQVSPHNMGYYSEICLEVEAGVLSGSSLISANM